MWLRKRIWGLPLIMRLSRQLQRLPNTETELIISDAIADAWARFFPFASLVTQSAVPPAAWIKRETDGTLYLPANVVVTTKSLIRFLMGETKLTESVVVTERDSFRSALHLVRRDAFKGMERMKRDMAGGGAVVCAMRAIGRLRPSVRVIGVVPAAENMPGGRAIRPGDVLTAANGKRVEVLNTDAEGRLILGDALTLAQRLGATHLVDIATLTGACVVALGHHASGLLGAPAAWVESVRQVADRAGERVWPLPMFEEYAEQLQSETADLTNTGGRPGGAITAGMFLKTFSGGLPTFSASTSPRRIQKTVGNYPTIWMTT